MTPGASRLSTRARLWARAARSTCATGPSNGSSAPGAPGQSAGVTVSARPGRPALDGLGHARGHEREDYVEQGDRVERWEDLEVRGLKLAGALRDIAYREHGEQRGVLEHGDELVAERRHHYAQGLRQHHETGGLPAAQAHRPGRFDLATGDRLDAGTEDLGHVGGVT